MSLFGSDPKQKVVDYFISVHYGLCHGPVDEVREIWYGEKRLWEGSEVENTQLSIDKKGLFGGNKVEGGFQGEIDLMFGEDDQQAPGRLQTVMGRNGVSNTAASQLPGYRGLFSFLVSAASKGANIGSNTAQVKPWWVRCRRRPKGTPFDEQVVSFEVDGQRLANPAAVIWECLTNVEWGMGTPSSSLNVASFDAAAWTLYGESFGISILWHQQQSIEEFVGDIVDHIDASLAMDPFEGTLRLKLIRGDYDPEDLPRLTPEDSDLTKFNRRGWGETLNEVNVEWTNPETEQTETVTVHDIANINLQGGALVSETRTYIGIRNADLALRVAARELQSGASALATAEVKTNRRQWRLMPGDVVALEWPDYEFETIPMRVSAVDYGKPGDSMITLTLIEDVFGMPVQTYAQSGGSQWVDPAIDPEPLQHRRLVSAWYYRLVQQVGQVQTDAIGHDTVYDLVFGTHASTNVFDYDLMAKETDAAGTSGWQSQATVLPAARGELTQSLDAEVESIMPSPASLVRGDEAVVGSFIWLGDDEEDAELALVTAIDGAGYHLRRGVLDTVPREHSAGTRVWFLTQSTTGTTGIDYAPGEQATVRTLTRTSRGSLAIEEDQDLNANLNDRLHRPYRPGNLRAFGARFPGPGTYPEYPVTIEWSHRDRTAEVSSIDPWDADDTGPESGVEYRVLVEAIQEDGSVDGTVDETTVAGTEYTLEDADIPSALAGSPFIRVTVIARRDGLDSWQSPSIRFRAPLRAPEIITIEAIED